MSARQDKVHFRFEMPIDLRDALKRKCRRAGRSMSETLCTLIQQYLGINTDPGEEKAGERQQVLDLSTRDERPQTASRSESHFIGNLRTQLAYISEVQTHVINGQGHAYRLAQNTDSEVQKLSADVSDLKQLYAKRPQQPVIKPAQNVPQKPDVFLIGTGIGLGVIATVLVLWASAGTGFGRRIAIFMAGESDRIQAAQIIAGRGSEFEGKLIRESAALIAEPRYGLKFAQCVKEAKKANGYTMCTLSLPPMVGD